MSIKRRKYDWEFISVCVCFIRHCPMDYPEEEPLSDLIKRTTAKHTHQKKGQYLHMLCIHSRLYAGARADSSRQSVQIIFGLNRLIRSLVYAVRMLTSRAAK